jgi:hypothetical protein
MTNNIRRHPGRGAVVLWEALSLIEYRLKKALIQPGLTAVNAAPVLLAYA